MKLHDIVLLSTADWDNPFWTNKQHVAVELARLGHRVLYIDSLGLRRPSASARDLRRIFWRIFKALRPPRKVRNDLFVWSPIVLPWHGICIINWFNRVSLRSGLTFWLVFMNMKRDWLWTYNPITTDFFDLSSFQRCIYHCVDEIKAQPGMPVEALEHAEELLVRSADIVFTTSIQLTETRRNWNDRTFYLPNVADYEHFSTAMSDAINIPDDLAAIPSPRLGFIGAISGYKLDFSLIRKIAEEHPAWSVVLIGSVGEGDPWTDCSLLKGLPNIYLFGARDYGVLPAYLKGFDVALLPNRINEYTDSMFPMKFFEYLAAGKPIVSVNLKAIRDYADFVYITDTTDAFNAAIERVLEGDIPPLNQRLELAREHTYKARTNRMMTLIYQVCFQKIG